jgi:dihydrofolate reductase
MAIKIIAAMDSNCNIGKDGKLPWQGKPEYRWDMVHFKETTRNNIVVMGFNTFLSLNSKALPNRVNYVVSKKHANLITDPNVNKIFTSVEDLIDWYQRWCLKEMEDIYIIGGAKIYKEFLQSGLVDEIILSIFDEKFDADISFPKEYLYKTHGYRIDESKIKVYGNGKIYTFIRMTNKEVGIEHTYHDLSDIMKWDKNEINNK